MRQVLFTLVAGFFTGLASGLVLKYWSEIRQLRTSKPWLRTRQLDPTRAFAFLATDLAYWTEKLGEKVFVLRLLPFELTPKLFEMLELGNYNKLMEPYKEAIITIVREGKTGSVEYWDASIFGSCQNPTVDGATSYALSAMYFPSQTNPMDSEARQVVAVNTSVLALTRQPIRDSIFVIGEFTAQARPGRTLLEYMDSVKWKVGYSFQFNPLGGTFRAQWVPTPCTRTLAKERKRELVRQWCETWQSLPDSCDSPLGGDTQKVNVININVDQCASTSAKQWHAFISTWYLTENSEWRIQA